MSATQQPVQQSVPVATPVVKPQAVVAHASSAPVVNPAHVCCAVPTGVPTTDVQAMQLQLQQM